MKQFNRSAGFTLIEIMVVMVILGLLVAIVAPNILGRSDQARVTVAQTQMSNIGNALDLYRLDNSHYPSSQQGLEALVSKPNGSPEPRNWNPDGYLKSVPVDPWDNEYQYISPGADGPYDLFSYGSDGREGGEGDAADISVWDSAKN
ncbi:MAG: type II secretion system protein GspG [Alteromonadaceae bacterium]|uniref:type II secretion system major pseudopilin GspG n=1 Tax=unclassified Marinobacter TaxID=83889 RepID=UPI000C55F949|nr:type II secretion system major pseudopilin GspG [Marinobacter sp. BGYM27]MAA64034.1 type II secretion system protein GspG [Alteromonadaceae bacterium]MBH85808.1 type II secretion system protein GspG [Alteromonadaceae bacterium]MDG5500292.1 type II secretion system major pseudopilin GspG [Marinobacter sp. BGYM27]|tara:strand:- start:22597 stop:23037 length:441 start_codon:yes stop_codon:yes gene_type:complete